MLTTPAGTHSTAGAPLEAAALGQQAPRQPAPRQPALGDHPRRPPSAATCVDEVEQRVEGVRLDARDPHHVPAGLLHAAREERREVRAAGRQHQAVYGERLRTHLQPHVAEALPSPQPVDLGQQEAGVSVGAGAAAAAAAAFGRRGARHGAARGAGASRRSLTEAPPRRMRSGARPRTGPGGRGRARAGGGGPGRGGRPR